MKKISTLPMLFLSVCLLTNGVSAQEKGKEQTKGEVKVSSKSEEAPKAKILNPAEHDSSSNTHYGQTLYSPGVTQVSQHPSNNVVAGQGDKLPSGREDEARAFQEAQAKNVMQPPPQPEIIKSGNAPMYERMDLFNSYLKGIVENVTPVHISPKLLTSSLDLPQGDILVDVAKRGENNVRAFALIIRLTDGSHTSVFQVDRGENFKVGNLVQAPIILIKNDFIVGTFKKIQ